MIPSRFPVSALTLLILMPNVAHAAPAPLARGGDAITRLREADANRDGTVSRAELLSYRTSQWSRFDRNGDGYFTPEDLPAFLRDRWNGGRLAEMRHSFDANRDGRISRAEFTHGPTPAFDLADANGDGRVTEAEFRAATAAAKDARAQR